MIFSKINWQNNFEYIINLLYEFYSLTLNNTSSSLHGGSYVCEASNRGGMAYGNWSLSVGKYVYFIYIVFINNKIQVTNPPFTCSIPWRVMLSGFCFKITTNNKCTSNRKEFYLTKIPWQMDWPTIQLIQKRFLTSKRSFVRISHSWPYKHSLTKWPVHQLW